MTETATEYEPKAENYYPTVVEFVTYFLVRVYARPIMAQRTDFRWCPRWWEHAEAIARLEALWKAWEVLRLDEGTGIATWWRDYCDPTMHALCASDGPFRQCSDTQHDIPPALPLIAPPRDMFVTT